MAGWSAAEAQAFLFPRSWPAGKGQCLIHCSVCLQKENNNTCSVAKLLPREKDQWGQHEPACSVLGQKLDMYFCLLKKSNQLIIHSIQTSPLFNHNQPTSPCLSKQELYFEREELKFVANSSGAIRRPADQWNETWGGTLVSCSFLRKRNGKTGNVLSFFFLFFFLKSRLLYPGLIERTSWYDMM